jgi:putative addiction module component (TIGR02574 family)
MTSSPSFHKPKPPRSIHAQDCLLFVDGYNVFMTKKELHDQVLALPPTERARLAHEIISSLDGPADGGAAEVWVREIERRVREVKNGSVKLVDWKDTRARILKRLSSGR